MPSKYFPLLLVLCISSFSGFSQRFLSDYDSTLFLKDTMPDVVRRLENLHFSGYIQPQFQVAQRAGAESFGGGNFQPYSKSRFMLRRARVKIDDLMQLKGHQNPLGLFTFQIDATERGVNVRDMFLKVYEPNKGDLSMTMGLFARPFGFEVNYSSSYRETPERGRMSQILMPTERDLGAMVSWDPRQQSPGSADFKLDAGVFNGQGLAATAEFDTYKDFIARATLKRLSLSRDLTLSGGLSFLNGGWRQQTRYRYETVKGSTPVYVLDSSLENIGTRVAKEYYGADMQLSLQHGWGETEIRGEYWTGKQPGTAVSTMNPGSLPSGPSYLRQFDGAFFYFLQNLVNSKWQLLLKYDWYDPNTHAAGKELNAAAGFTSADVKYSTLGTGLVHYANEHLKFIAYYDQVKNEITSLPDYTTNRKDNIFTFRIQMLF